MGQHLPDNALKEQQRKKFALAVAAAVIPLGLWASPASASEENYRGDTTVTFIDTNGDQQSCNVYSDAVYDPSAATIEVYSTDMYRGTMCEVEETTIQVSYLDASGQRQRVIVRSGDGYERLQATGVAMEPVVTLVKAFKFCDYSANDTCSDGPTYNAYTAPK